ncbi:MAG TPA: nitroreductase family protein [Candidatus Izemoplasmatales bacterium]|nr:nitroreductase family protein [Candidatus Izemoplasmatales bacterium]
MEFLQALKTRHSEYQLTKDIYMEEDDLKAYLEDILINTPSAFNSQSQRMVVLSSDKHDLLWDYLTEKMKDIVKGDQYNKTKEKLLGFKAAFATILFYDDTETTKKLQEQLPLYKENFAKWSIEQNGMLQSNVWVGLRTKNIGASLQHYNELIDEFVKKEFNIPETWDLRAQMPFGHIEIAGEEKEHMDIEKRFTYIK